jgi:hypothetical protein
MSSPGGTRLAAQDDYEPVFELDACTDFTTHLTFAAATIPGQDGDSYSIASSVPFS